jgi:predicted kinase
MQQSQQTQDLQILRSSISKFPEAVVSPAFIVVSGLPGTGKSFFCARLANRGSFLILESDSMRKLLFPIPCYSGEESARLFMVLHTLIEELLTKGVPLIFDATNMVEHHRERLYCIGAKAGAKFLLISVEAPPELVYKRLQKRVASCAPSNHSDADWNVYQKMSLGYNKICRNHLLVDTSRDINPVIDKVIKMISR